MPEGELEPVVDIDEIIEKITALRKDIKQKRKEISDIRKDLNRLEALLF